MISQSLTRPLDRPISYQLDAVVGEPVDTSSVALSAGAEPLTAGAEALTAGE